MINGLDTRVRRLCKAQSIPESWQTKDFKGMAQSETAAQPRELSI